MAQILHENCAVCHRDQGAGPFPLLDYDDAREHARRIVSMVESGAMPPWPPSRPSDAFADERGLEDSEVALLRQWLDDGMPVGDSLAVPDAPTWTEGWQLGTPDVVLELEGGYLVTAGGDELFRNFILPVSLDSAVWIAAVELDPGSARVVHHATLAIDRTGGSRALDAEDAEPGFDGMGSAGGVEHPAGVFLGWTPGHAAHGGPAGASWRLTPGTDVVARLHLRPIDESVEVRPRVALYLADGPPERPPVSLQLGAQTMDIPAGERAYEVRDSFRIAVDLDVLSVYPHAHYLGDTIQAWADAPTGERIWLLEIPQWDFDWQDEYRFLAPVALPAGSTLHMRYTFDNSADNPRNPANPPVRVSYGPRSVDEMADLIVQTVPRTRDGAVNLQRAVDVHIAEVKLGGYQLAIAQGREDAPLRYNMGIAEAARGRAVEAESHFRDAIRLDPDFAEAFINLGIVLHQQDRVAEAAQVYTRATQLAPEEARAHHNLGVALDELGRGAEAEAHFRQAVASDPAFALSHRRLAQVARARGDLEGAIASYRSAIASDPDDVDSRMGLGIVLGQTGNGVGALASFRAAGALVPDSPQPLIAMADLLANYPDASVRQPAEAVRLAERAVEISRRADPAALLTLATARAAAGDLRGAAAGAEEAVAIARQSGNAAAAQAAEARLARYRAGRP
ncbi:MAG: tetratricopeptide repeat protein [Longimicrobiales bacterium]